MNKENHIGKKASIIMLLSAILLIASVSLLSFATAARPERWIPCTPSPEQVKLAFWNKADAAYINVTITFYTGGYEVRNWGVVNARDSELWTDAEIWRSTGPAVQVVTKTTHIYSLGYLKPGTYTFTFKAWGQTVKTASFMIIITPPSPIIPPPSVPVIPPPTPIPTIPS